ncbi:MAG: helix-turn-helix transcriptional regulator [Clostridia bacterium]|nr:helix-turn-helix transcriptional regulator [Clostridia bacterium]MBQ8717009.1 helix-turn-helix transcriptional regulator [Clostridia bacterium]
MLQKPPIITHAEFFKLGYEKRPPVTVSARPFCSLSIRKSGETVVEFDGKRLISAPDTLTYIPAGCTYTTYIPKEGEMYLLHFYTAPEGGELSPVPLCVRSTVPSSFYHMFENAIAHFSAEGCDLHCMSAAYELLSEASAAFFHTRPAPPKRMLRCKAYLDENVCDTALRVGTLAEMCGVSEVYFRREFKKFYGASPLEYIKKRRVEIACQLLSTGLYNVTQVAERAGFDSVSYFSAEFRRLTGQTPSQYQSRV